MKKATWIPLLIIIIGVCLALAGFAAGGMRAVWHGIPAAPIAPAAPISPAAPGAPEAPEAPEAPAKPGLFGWVKGFWIDRSGIHLADPDRGALVSVDESYAGFKDIELKADFFDRITFMEGDAYTVRGMNYERYGGLTVRLDGDRLSIDSKRKGRWLNFGLDELFNRTQDNSWVEITYPRGAKLGIVNANVSAGRIFISGFDCEDLYIDNSFGRIEVSSASCGKLTVKSASGDTRLSGVDVRGSASVKNDFGNVGMSDIGAINLTVDLNAGNADIKGVKADTFTLSNDFGKIELGDAVANSLTLKLNSGDLSANNVRAGNLLVDSSFGAVRFDRLELSGRGEITQNAGDVNIRLDMSEDDLSYELSTDAGNVSIDGMRSGSSLYSRNANASASLRIDSDFGNIKLQFLK